MGYLLGSLLQSENQTWKGAGKLKNTFVCETQHRAESKTGGTGGFTGATSNQVTGGAGAVHQVAGDEAAIMATTAATLSSGRERC